MGVNLYPAFLSFLLGFVMGFPYEWFWNHYRRFTKIISYILIAWLIFEVIEAFFIPDALLRRDYSELQGWVNSANAFSGAVIGFYLEDRYEVSKMKKKEAPGDFNLN